MIYSIFRTYKSKRKDGEVRDQPELHLEDTALQELAEALGTQSDASSVLHGAFDWYYVPRSDDRIAYAQRVLQLAEVNYKNEGVLPDWFWRVYALQVLGATYDSQEGVPPPPDPKRF